MPIADANHLKRLQTRISEQREKTLEAQKNVDRCRTILKQEGKKLQELEKSLKNFVSSKEGLVVTEHALLRYCERVLKIDLEKAKTEIVTETLKEQVEKLGNGEYPNGDFRVVIREGQVVSVV